MSSDEAPLNREDQHLLAPQLDALIVATNTDDVAHSKAKSPQGLPASGDSARQSPDVFMEVGRSIFTDSPSMATIPSDYPLNDSSSPAREVTSSYGYDAQDSPSPSSSVRYRPHIVDTESPRSYSSSPRNPLVSVTAPATPLSYFGRSSSPNSPPWSPSALYSTSRFNKALSMSPRHGMTMQDVQLNAKLSLEDRQMWMTELLDLDHKIDTARTLRTQRNPASTASFETPVTLINTNNILPGKLKAKPVPPFKQSWPHQDPKSVAGSHAQLVARLAEEHKGDEVAFNHAMRRMEAEIAAEERRRVAAAAAAQDRLAAAAEREAQIQARAAHLLHTKTARLEAKHQAKHALSEQVLRRVTSERVLGAQSWSERQRERSARAAECKQALEHAKAAMRTQEHRATKARLSAIVTPVKIPSVPIPPPTQPYLQHKHLVAQYLDYVGSKADHKMRTAYEHDAAKWHMHNTRSRCLSANRTAREERFGELSTQRRAEFQALLDSVVYKHSHIQHNNVRRAALRSAQDLELQMSQRADVVGSFWSKELKLTALQKKQLFPVPNTAASMLASRPFSTA